MYNRNTSYSRVMLTNRTGEKGKFTIIVEGAGSSMMITSLRKGRKMKKGGLRYLMALLCAVMVGLVAINNVNVSAAIPSGVEAPKNLTVAYSFEYWRQSPSSLELTWKNPSSIQKLAEEGEVKVKVQIDWKFSKNDDWKYSESWDRMEKKVVDSNWEYIENGWGLDEDKNKKRCPELLQ